MGMLLAVSVDNVALKDTCSLSAYKYPPPHPRASGEKHVLLRWRSPEPVKVQHIVLWRLPLLLLLSY